MLALDDLAKYNMERWNELAVEGVQYSRPALDLDQDTARLLVDPQGILGELSGVEVLCLAAGGGQQSAAFGLLGAKVTVFDLSENQLALDRLAASHYRFQVKTIQGDMRDLSSLGSQKYDLVWHAYSINFIPDPARVFKEIVTVIRPGSLYRLEFANPFVVGLDETAWAGNGYPLHRPYIDGEELVFQESAWVFEKSDGRVGRVEGPREFRHILSSVVNPLIVNGFHMLGIWEAAGERA